jgi:hypothetical protein
MQAKYVEIRLISSDIPLLGPSSWYKAKKVQYVPLVEKRNSNALETSNCEDGTALCWVFILYMTAFQKL